MNLTPPPSSQTPPAPLSFQAAARFWLLLGFISFGGPAGQISIMFRELVEKRRWISERRFLHALNYCMVLPGPEAQQLATYLGWLMFRTWGGLLAGVLFVLPSLVILIGLSFIYLRFGDVPMIAGIFLGIKPGVTAIVVHAAYRIGSKTLNNALLKSLALSSFILVYFFKLPFPILVLGAGLLGYLISKKRPDLLQTQNQHGPKTQQYGPALIDDDTPTPDHAKFRKSRFLITALVGAVLWLVPMLALYQTLGWDHHLTQMAWFFSKAALLTLGGAYAVLPYVNEGAVFQYGWLQPNQMIDGLALGETTPGPLIMVVAFVGFVGGYLKTALGPDLLFASGALAACIVTWFTFLPSFLFIFLGGPLVESTHNQTHFTAPLTAISAAIVGVIANLALFFAYHVFWPGAFPAGFDGLALLIFLLAVLALFRFKWQVTHLIAACAAIGLLRTLIN